MSQILVGDVLKMLAKIAAQSVNCIITSPPYFGLRDYQLPPTHWPEVSYAPMPGLSPLTIPEMVCCLGLEDSIEAYVAHMVFVFRKLWRVLRGDGVAWLNLGDSYAGSWGNYGGQNRGNGKQREIINGSKIKQKSYEGLEDWRPPTANVLAPKNLCFIPSRVALALQADGWYVRSDIIWHKLNPMPESCQDRPTKSHEYVFLLAKSERYWYDQDAIREPQVTQSLEEAQKRCGKAGAQYDKWEDKNGFRGIGGLNKETKNYNPAGRNKRTVWSLASTPFPGAHFAVMPEALVEPCMLAGCPAQVCVECGEPWVREVEKVKGNPTSFNGSSFNRGKTHRAQSALSEVGKLERTTRTKTLRFTPTCQCCPLPAVSTDKFGRQWPVYTTSRPGITLDPFFGSGTVGVAAEKLKRDWLGIELNPEYAELAKDRLASTQPALFAR